MGDATLPTVQHFLTCIVAVGFYHQEVVHQVAHGWFDFLKIDREAAVRPCHKRAPVGQVVELHRHAFSIQSQARRNAACGKMRRETLCISDAPRPASACDHTNVEHEQARWDPLLASRLPSAAPSAIGGRRSQTDAVRHFMSKDMGEKMRRSRGRPARRRGGCCAIAVGFSRTSPPARSSSTRASNPLRGQFVRRREGCTRQK